MKKIIILLSFLFIFSCTIQNSVYAEGNITKKLEIGDKNSEVAVLQDILIQKGYLIGTSDGSFGPKTWRALKVFQIAEGLQADGIVGTRTRVLLLKNVSSVNSNQPNFTMNSTIVDSKIKNNPDTKKEVQKCTSSICVTLNSPNGGEIFSVGQRITSKWKSAGFDNSFREENIFLVRKDGDTYTTLYSLGSGVDRGSYELLEIPKGLKNGSNYALKIIVHNMNGQEAVDYSDRTFSIKNNSISTCVSPSVVIAVAPTFSIYNNVGLLGDYTLSVGGGENCTARIRGIKFKSNVTIAKWRTQFTDVSTSQNGDILTLTMKEPLMTISGELVSVPDEMGTPTADGHTPVKTYKKQSQSLGINVWADGLVVPAGESRTENLIDPIAIEAVDINGEPITNIIGLK